MAKRPSPAASLVRLGFSSKTSRFGAAIASPWSNNGSPMVRIRSTLILNRRADDVCNMAVTAEVGGCRSGVQWSHCAAEDFNLACPLWVKSGHRNQFVQCPLYPQKRTSDQVLYAGCSARQNGLHPCAV